MSKIPLYLVQCVAKHVVDAIMGDITTVVGAFEDWSFPAVISPRHLLKINVRKLQMAARLSGDWLDNAGMSTPFSPHVQSPSI